MPARSGVTGVWYVQTQDFGPRLLAREQCPNLTGRAHDRGRSGRPTFQALAMEIYGDGEPLPVRIRESGFKTEHTATLAPSFVLLIFVAGASRRLFPPTYACW
jgi:hypothetical protein